MNISIYPGWKNALDHFVRGEFDYGSTISHERMDDMLQLKRPDGATTMRSLREFDLKRLRAVDSLRKALLTECMMDLRAVPGAGFMVLKPQDQTNVAVRDCEAIIRKAIRGKKMRLAFTNHAMLNDEQRKENTDAILRTSQQVSVLRAINRGTLPVILKKMGSAK